MSQFTFVGGVRKPTPHTTEKFLLFLLSGDAELSAFDAKASGLLTLDKGGRAECKLKTVKILYHRSGFGAQKITRNFFVRLLDKPLSGVEIFPPNSLTGGYVFRSDAARLLTPKEALSLVNPGSISAKMLRAEIASPYSTAVQNAMVRVTTTPVHERLRVRKIQMGGAE